MSTRCFIGIQMDSDAIIGIYNHHDGYLKGVGATLLQHYTTEKQIWKLLSYGNRPSLDVTPEKGNIREGDYTGPIFGRSINEIFEQLPGIDFVYVYDRLNGIWKFETIEEHTLMELTREITS